MADRGEIVDYVVKSLEKLIVEPQKLVEKDLSSFSLRIKKTRGKTKRNYR